MEKITTKETIHPNSNGKTVTVTNEAGNGYSKHFNSAGRPTYTTFIRNGSPIAVVPDRSSRLKLF